MKSTVFAVVPSIPPAAHPVHQTVFAFSRMGSSDKPLEIILAYRVISSTSTLAFHRMSVVMPVPNLIYRHYLYLDGGAYIRPISLLCLSPESFGTTLRTPLDILRFTLNGTSAFFQTDIPSTMSSRHLYRC